ncbi:MAG: LemA family protein [Pseudomonadota bacterium]
MELWIAIGVVALLLIYVIATYNRLVSYRARTEEAWSDVKVQMKRRYDLVPNLVETVKGYAAHESETLEAVVQARNRAIAADGAPAEQAGAESALSGALQGIFALAESYPDLKANQNFLQLQHDLTDTENRVNSARRFYNGSVKEMNVAIRSFPSNLLAGAFHFEEAHYFELDASEADAARQLVQVDFKPQS